jgi:RNA polymerase sigma factor (sigma-70 family)
MTPINQQEILKALGQPDIEAPVALLYEHYFEGIVSQICFQGGSREDGADIFQEAILILITKVKTKQFRGDSSLKTFLTGIARNLWLTEFRSQGRRVYRERAFMQQTQPHTPAPEPQEENEAVVLSQVIERLGENCRKILTGYYYEEKSMKELLTLFKYENEQVLRNKKSKCMKSLKEMINANPYLLKNLKSQSLYA